MPIVAIPDVLQEQLGTKAATALVDMMNQALEEQQRIVLTLAEDRFERRFSEELSKIREELALMRAEFREQLAALGAELRQEMATQGAELRQEMAQRHSELIRWMFIFWIGQFISIAALVIALAQLTK